MKYEKYFWIAFVIIVAWLIYQADSRVSHWNVVNEHLLREREAMGQ